jgi:hypothetical protein
LYISIEYATATHRCPCGCGNRVVTPLSPADWELTFDGETVSLYPSLGNWSLQCQSHYWVRRNQIIWAAKWTGEEIEKGRMRDWLARQHYHGDRVLSTEERKNARIGTTLAWARRVRELFRPR